MAVKSLRARPSSLLPDTIEPEEFLAAALAEPMGEVLSERAVLEALLAPDVSKAVSALVKAALSE